MKVGDVGCINNHLEVLQVHPVLRVDADGVDFILSGINTSSLVDGRGISISSMPVEVVETTSYATVIGGARTVFHVRVLNDSTVERIDALRADIARERAVEAAIEAEERKWRSWRRSNGESTDERRLIAVLEGRAFLLGRDGSVTSLALSELHPRDKDTATRASKEATPSDIERATAALEEYRKSQIRTWKSADGRFSVDAFLVSMAGDVVTLRKDDGSSIKVSIERLCDEDRQFIATKRKSSE